MNTWIEGPPPREKRRMGCVGKGCLILACFIVFLIIAGAIGLYFGMRTHSAVLHSFYWAKKMHVLAQEPSPVPQFETTDENITAAERKWKDFENTRDQPAYIELTADDLNNLIAKNRHARSKAFVAIEGNRLHIQTSVPLGEYVGRGRYYLNGDIVIVSDGPQSLENPRLSSITINNEPVPSDVLEWKYRDRPLRDYLREFRTTYGSGSIEIRDGKLIIDRRGSD
jgi:hypothetical protein